jgi:hypothetical protein
MLIATRMPGRSYSGPLPPRDEQRQPLRTRLEQHVVTLASAIDESNLWHYRGLEATATYISDSLQSGGYRIPRQTFEVHGKSVTNLKAILHGSPLLQESVVVGAHCDSVFGSPGANDNASGIAALMEIARTVARRPTVQFVAFVNEEPPFYHTHNMGSSVYANRVKRRGDDTVGMPSLEILGFYSDDVGSQRYPFPFGLFYPATGSFLAFVGNLASHDLVRRTIGSFRAPAYFPPEETAAPGWLPGVAWSDHWAF